jgi:hypothetical protein
VAIEHSIRGTRGDTRRTALDAIYSTSCVGRQREICKSLHIISNTHGSDDSSISKWFTRHKYCPVSYNTDDFTPCAEGQWRAEHDAHLLNAKILKTFIFSFSVCYPRDPKRAHLAGVLHERTPASRPCFMHDGLISSSIQCWEESRYTVTSSCIVGFSLLCLAYPGWCRAGTHCFY